MLPAGRRPMSRRSAPRSYGYDATMQLKEMDETLALAEVDNAVAQDGNIVFFCYTDTRTTCSRCTSWFS